MPLQNSSVAMLTVTVILIALIALNVAGNTPEYDYSYSPNGGDKGECMFKGTKSTDNANACKTELISRIDFKQNGDLTWKILTKTCPDLIRAGCGDPRWSTDEYPMEDLEWPSCNICPRCPCNNGSVNTYYIYNGTQFDDPFEYSICYECECKKFNTYQDEQGNDLYARSCKTDYIFTSPNALNNIQCPFTTSPPTSAPIIGGCSDGGNPETVRNVGEYFFYYGGGNCDTYCTCNATNSLQCETGWDNIMRNKNLKYKFLDQCKNSLQGAWNDTSRWHNYDNVGVMTNTCPNDDLKRSPDPIVSNICPNGDCDMRFTGESWNSTQYQQTIYKQDGSIDYILYDCIYCQCVNSLVPPACWITTPSCFNTSFKQDDDSLICSFGVNTNLNDTTLCTESATNITYCGWNQHIVPINFDPDNVCIADEIKMEANWGCQKDYECDAFFGYENLSNSDVGFCSYNSVTFTAKTYDCLHYEWLCEEYTININQMCCGKGAGKQCNQQIPGKYALGIDNKCKPSDAVASYYQTKYECLYGERGINNNDFIKHKKCAVDLIQGEYDVCSVIGDYWKWETNCECKQYQILEKYYPIDEYHNKIRHVLQLKFDTNNNETKQNLEKWNVAYQCGKTFECNITHHVNSFSICNVAATTTTGVPTNDPFIEQATMTTTFQQIPTNAPFIEQTTMITISTSMNSIIYINIAIGIILIILCLILIILYWKRHYYNVNNDIIPQSGLQHNVIQESGNEHIEINAIQETAGQNTFL
eukprot:213508_1